MNEERNNIMEDAREWAFQASGSRAVTEKGKERAIEAFIGGRNLLDVYKGEIEKDMERVAQHPLFARYFFAQTTEVKKLYASVRGTMTIPAEMQDVLKKAAFQHLFDRSRFRKKYYGENSLRASIRTKDNKKRGWHRVVWHYADYSAIISPDGRQIWYDIGTGYKLASITPAGTTRIEGSIIRRKAPPAQVVIRPHHLRRFYSSAIRGTGIIWRWNMKEGRGEYIHIASGESYHTPIPQKQTNPKEIFHQAVSAFRRRRDEKKQKMRAALAEEILAKKPVFVSIDDSIRAGNCRVLTEEFAKQIFKKIGVASSNVCILASYILSVRDDVYTRRACIQAALRYV